MELSFEQLPAAVSHLLHEVASLKTILQQQAENPTVEQPDEIFTIEQAAEFLNLTKPTLYSKVSRKELPVLKRSKRLYFSRADLIDYLKAGRQKTKDELQAEASEFLQQKTAKS